MDAQPYDIILGASLLLLQKLFITQKPLSTADLGSENSSNYDMDIIEILQ
ncbi:hypothetical protein BB561_005277 [Smittium simulii]|uniref:Uncharacterized protein n=1 Tax=Smittium simulii TaxID=133385 RepID=A0A2T9YBA2_9FUNG|nr:hypothetical protein BB561_005277 [Smittium simulii]